MSRRFQGPAYFQNGFGGNFEYLLNCCTRYRSVLCPAYKNNNQTRGGLGRVCATGMYRSIVHVEFPKFQTGIFVEWKSPGNLAQGIRNRASD